MAMDSSGPAIAAVDGAPGAVEAFGYRQELKRSLSNFDLLVYGLVFIVPGAPISIYGIVFNASDGMVPLVFLVGLVAMLFTAASYVSMSRTFPIAGSVYAYAGRVIGASAGFIAGWVMLLDYLLLPTLVYVLCAVAMHSVMPDIPRVAWIVAFVAFNTVINVMGIETTARLSRYILIIQLIVLAAFMVMAVFALANGTAGAHFSMTPLFNPALITPSLIFGALSLAVLSFLGFDAISTLAEEATGGARAVGRATYLSLIVTASIFVVLTYTASLFVLDKTSFPKGDATDAAFYNIAMAIGGYWLKWLLAAPGVLFAGLPGALAAQVATTRLLFSMARDGKLPRALAHVSPKRKVPERAALLVSAVSLILGIALAEHLELLTSMVNFGALVGFLMLHTSVVVYFGRRRDVASRWLHVATAGVGFTIIGYVLVNLHATALVAGLSWLCVGLIVLGYQKWSGQHIELP